MTLKYKVQVLPHGSKVYKVYGTNPTSGKYATSPQFDGTWPQFQAWPMYELFRPHEQTLVEARAGGSLEFILNDGRLRLLDHDGMQDRGNG